MLSKSASIITMFIVASLFAQLSHHHVHASSPILKRVAQKDDDMKKRNKKYNLSSAARRVLSHYDNDLSKNVENVKEGSFEKRASPFGQIEKVFVETLEEEEFGRKLPLVEGEQLSFDYLIVEPPGRLMKAMDFFF
jgi:hypothetical protein